MIALLAGARACSPEGANVRGGVVDTCRERLLCGKHKESIGWVRQIAWR
jgi:hypothetical protein